jgi:hypothetical protein
MCFFKSEIFVLFNFKSKKIFKSCIVKVYQFSPFQEPENFVIGKSLL